MREFSPLQPRGALVPAGGGLNFASIVAIARLGRRRARSTAKDCSSVEAKVEIERLFSSPALFRTLALFYEYPGEPLHPRLIARYTRTDIKSVLRELRKLEEMGLLRCRPAGRWKLFTLDTDHPAHGGLRSLFAARRASRGPAFPTPAARIWEDLMG